MYTAVGLRVAEIYAEANAVHKPKSVMRSLSTLPANMERRFNMCALSRPNYPPAQPTLSSKNVSPAPPSPILESQRCTKRWRKERINKGIGERKTRLGATLGVVTMDVKSYMARRGCEEKLLQRAYDTLLVLPKGKKTEKREQVM
ncbi:hypothetical protein K469DRAFT_710886 [Zopfia rhizophila CBS 207.26]|uniref:Uncharacterized protein n=1 Tax=Zopfia rhizophila CBS 207.26 TaxID=1314779 RepID=A0A6A6DX84_9PEZI|nr:hypothetical protein K469DRAFT_710886 [Zopfia rhizophila CBS 207.26]